MLLHVWSISGLLRHAVATSELLTHWPKLRVVEVAMREWRLNRLTIRRVREHASAVVHWLLAEETLHALIEVVTIVVVLVVLVEVEFEKLVVGDAGVADVEARTHAVLTDVLQHAVREAGRVDVHVAVRVKVAALVVLHELVLVETVEVGRLWFDIRRASHCPIVRRAVR